MNLPSRAVRAVSLNTTMRYLRNVKKILLLVVSMFLLTSLSSCASKPAYGYFESTINFYCFQGTDYEFRSYEAEVTDVSGNFISTAPNVDIIVWNDSNGGRYLTGTCRLTARFSDIPLEGGPYIVTYSVDGNDLPETDEFDSTDLIAIID